MSGILAARRGSVTPKPAPSGPVVSNVIINGGFNSEDNWSGAWWSGKTIDGGKANFIASPAYDGFWQPGAPLTVGKYYELVWTISGYSSGNVYPLFTGGTTRSGIVRSANGTFTERLLVNAGNNQFDFMMETGGTLSVDDISLVGPYDTATVGGA